MRLCRNCDNGRCEAERLLGLLSLESGFFRLEVTRLLSKWYVLNALEPRS